MVFCHAGCPFEDIVAAIKACKDKLDGGAKWFISSGHSAAVWPKEKYNKEYLDKIFGDMPAYMEDETAHNALVNSAALKIAGVDLPRHIEGKIFLESGANGNWKAVNKHEYIFAARDRCDETVDRIRCVRSRQYKYLRNFLTDRPYMQPQYRDPWAVTVELRELARTGALNAVRRAVGAAAENG